MSTFVDSIVRISHLQECQLKLTNGCMCYTKLEVSIIHNYRPVKVEFFEEIRVRATSAGVRHVVAFINMYS